MYGKRATTQNSFPIYTTMKKNETQPKTVQGTAMAKNEVKPGPLVILKPAEPTEAELKKENEKLKKIIERIPQNLTERIVYYKQKQEWINNLKKITGERDQLLQLKSEIFDEMEQDEFFTENFAIAIVRVQKYGSDNNILKIQNPVLIETLLNVVLDKINLKVDELEISIAN